MLSLSMSTRQGGQVLVSHLRRFAGRDRAVGCCEWALMRLENVGKYGKNVGIYWKMWERETKA